MSYNFVISPLAEQDIDEIMSYILDESVRAADVFIDALYDAMQKLSDNPGIGHKKVENNL